MQHFTQKRAQKVSHSSLMGLQASWRHPDEFKGGEYEAIKNLSSEPVDVLQKIGLVKKIALYLKARVPDYMEVDDMVQIGMVGLMEASKSYDSSIGVTFDEYSKKKTNKGRDLG